MMVEFDMTDLRKMRYFLGIELIQRSDGIFIGQKKYTHEVLDRFRMDGCNPVHNPIVLGFKLMKYEDGVKIDSTFYKQIVGSLMYLTATRPDIMFIHLSGSCLTTAPIVASPWFPIFTKFRACTATEKTRNCPFGPVQGLDPSNLRKVSLRGLRLDSVNTLLDELVRPRTRGSPSEKAGADPKTPLPLLVESS
ncbi:hypothetical protein EZV62_019110 [Acer yangbiense]|uniref:Reverse transcriptase Ty1/copia-type domain-containing protein n=1 Tax=Acer yangbiense TaxID=1000413 RepID=A0A5C7HA90_9ROSI|nr:hypothetical protein EZV62_019110 [Acer yangbiense]